MVHDQFLRDIADRLSAEPQIVALFLAGSYGSTTADRHSDIDLVALVDQAHHARVARVWRSTMEDLRTVVSWNERRGGGVLLNAITDCWLRCDFYLTEPGNFVRRAQTTVKPLFDPNNIYSTLPMHLPPATPDPERVAYLIKEFIRVLGLMTVVIGRSDYVTMAKGVELLRELLKDLMLEECPLPDRGGALHLRRLLTPEQMELLEALPYPAPEPDELIAANIAMAGAFLPVARRLAEQLAIAWPSAFAKATHRHLHDKLGVVIEDLR
ncbi:MAG: nucleotidyltransferase domain-containing protein [Hyphomicrobiaceae bacterium]